LGDLCNSKTRMSELVLVIPPGNDNMCRVDLEIG
jgi:hypothetical protein